MNKKGDIPITILVIGIFLVCTIAYVTFVVENDKFKNSFFGLNLQENMNSNIEHFYTYLALGKTKQEAVDLIQKDSQADAVISYDSSSGVVVITQALEDYHFKEWLLHDKSYVPVNITKTFKP